MTNQEFRVWLSGYFDLENPGAILSAKQLWIIHNHLSLVEAVSGELDENNKWLKARLQTLPTVASPFMAAEFTAITNQLQNWLATL